MTGRTAPIVPLTWNGAQGSEAVARVLVSHGNGAFGQWLMQKAPHNFNSTFQRMFPETRRAMHRNIRGDFKETFLLHLLREILALYCFMAVSERKWKLNDLFVETMLGLGVDHRREVLLGTEKSIYEFMRHQRAYPIIERLEAVLRTNGGALAATSLYDLLRALRETLSQESNTWVYINSEPVMWSDQAVMDMIVDKVFTNLKNADQLNPNRRPILTLLVLQYLQMMGFPLQETKGGWMVTGNFNDKRSLKEWSRKASNSVFLQEVLVQ